MTTSPAGVTPRPATVSDAVPQPQDDGRFGPQSMTWQVMAGAVPSVAGTCAVTIQALHPRTMHLFAQASSYVQDPEQRGRLTQEYFQTIAFGGKVRPRQ